LSQIKAQAAEAAQHFSNGIIIHFAAWIASFGLIGVILVWYAQADAAQDKLASEWALSQHERQRLAKVVAFPAHDASNKHRPYFG
jgi:hypothetical protein